MIVITGATGQIGAKTAKKLLAQGKAVKVIARHAEKLEELKKLGATVAAGDQLDTAFLSKAFEGAEAVFLLIPPNLQSPNVGAHQDAVGESQLAAIKHAGVKKVLFISSQGAHDPEHAGVISGAGRQELRLNALPDDVDVISLRPAVFMENLFNQIGTIKEHGIMGSPVKADVSLGTIATEDIAEVAAQKLSKLDFKGKTHFDLLGARNYSQTEVASILGKAIGKEQLPYVEFSFEDTKKALMQYGISESMADGFNAMYKAINEGRVSISPRTAESTTPTTLEAFADNVFKYAYQG